jgi:alcohol dehydrogenase
MKALVYRGHGDKGIEDKPKPELQALGDAIVRMTKTTICGTDLHILRAMCRPACRGVHSGMRGPASSIPLPPE